MLISSDLSANLIIKGDLIKNYDLLIVFKQICHILTRKVNTKRKIIRNFGLHKLIHVLH